MTALKKVFTILVASGLFTYGLFYSISSFTNASKNLQTVSQEKQSPLTAGTETLAVKTAQAEAAVLPAATANVQTVPSEAAVTLPSIQEYLSELNKIVLDDLNGVVYIKDGDRNLGRKSVRLGSIYARNFTLDNSGNLTLDGKLKVKGETNIEDKLKVKDQATFKDDATFLDDVDVKDTLEVDGDTTLRENLTVKDDATFENDLTVEDSSVLGDASSDTLTVGATSTFNADVSINGNTTLGNAAEDSVTFNAAALALVNASTLNLVNSSATALNIESGLMDFDTQNSRVGIGTTAPAAKLHSLAVTEQLRLGYNAGNYSSFTVSSGGNLTVAPSGGTLNITGIGTVSSILQVGSATATTYSRFGAGVTGHSLDASNDLLISDDLEVDDDFFVDGDTTLGDASEDSVSVNASTLSLANASTLNLANSSTTSLNIESGLFDLDTQNSRVGIGTTAPGTTLDVTGTGRFSSTLTASNGFTLTTGALNMASTSGLVNLDLNSSASAFTVGGVFGVDTQNSRVGVGTTAPNAYLEVTVPTNQTGGIEVRGAPGALEDIAASLQDLSGVGEEGVLRLYNNGTDRVLLGANRNSYLMGGNLGIGTTSPAQKLSVDGNIEVFNNSSYTSKSTLGSTWALMWLDTSNDLFVNNPGGNLFIRANGNQSITATSGGNVGIGTTAPTKQFEVADDIYTQDNLYVGATTETLDNAGFVLDGNDAFVAGMMGVEGNIYTDGAFIAGSTLTLSDSSILDSATLNFGANNDSTNLLTLTSDATDLTIGTTDAANLTINTAGTLTLSDAVTASSTLAVNGNTTIGNEASDQLTINAGVLSVASAATLELATSATALNIESGLLNLDTQSSRVGIGTTAPGVTLDVVGGNIRTNNQLVSTIAIGTAPLVVTSTTVVTNLNADTVDGVGGGSFLRSDASDNYLTGGTLTFDAGSTVDINGDLTIADTNIAFDGATTTFTGTGAMTVTPGAGTNLNVSLSTTGDFAVNTNHLYVDTSEGNVGVGNAAPGEKLDVTGNIRSSGQLISTLAIGTAPLAVTSTTVVTNLNADTVDGITSGSFVRSDASDNYLTGGTLTFDAGSTLDVNGDLTIADTNIALDGASTTFTGTGALTFTPGAGTNLNISLSTTGDFTVNNDDLFVDTSAGNIGVGTTAPAAAIQAYQQGTGGNFTRLASFYDDTASAYPYIEVGFHRTGGGIIMGYTNNAGLSTNYGWISHTGLTPTNGQGIMISSSGNIGIGATSPANVLEVRSTTSPQLRVSYNDDNYVTFGVANNGAVTVNANGAGAAVAVSDTLTASNGFTLTTGALNLTASSGAADLTLGASQTAFNVNSGLFNIDTTASRVGVGTTAPGTKFAVAGLTGTASYNLVRVDTATGNFYYDSSSERYKEDIEEYETDFSKILDITPRSFTDRTSGTSEIGFIAEEFDEAGLEDLVIYKDGRPDALKYDKVPVYLLGVIKQQQDDMEALEERLVQLEAEEDVAVEEAPQSSESEEVEELANTVDELEVTEVLRVLGTLNVLGMSTLTDVTVTGDLTAGLIKIDSLENAFNIVGSECYNAETGNKNNELCASQTLYLQKTLTGNVDLFNGAVVLEPNGDVTIAGTLTVKDVVVENLKVAEGSDTLGSATLEAGSTSEEVSTDAVEESSKIFVTPRSAVDGALYVSDVNEGESFTVSVKETSEEDIDFDWWIINQN